MIATTGSTTPVITLSFAVKLDEELDEVISAAELIVGLEEMPIAGLRDMLVGLSDGDVVEVSGVAGEIKVAFTACTGEMLTVTCPITSCGACPFSQFENPRNELNWDATLDPKAVALALAGLVIDGPGILIAEPRVFKQIPSEGHPEVIE